MKRAALGLFGAVRAELHFVRKIAGFLPHLLDVHLSLLGFLIGKLLSPFLVAGRMLINCLAEAARHLDLRRHLALLLKLTLALFETLRLERLVILLRLLIEGLLAAEFFKLCIGRRLAHATLILLLADVLHEFLVLADFFLRLHIFEFFGLFFGSLALFFFFGLALYLNCILHFLALGFFFVQTRY